ncbi:MAG: hypothetical protein IJJ33_15540 [Victivallales bacterium]|nr:hypothetical protein [Victivallales bacterium]
MRPITWSYGMQSRSGSRIGESPDMEGAVQALADVGGEEAIVFAKDHTGFCFYPTNVGVPHPRLKVNLTKGMTDALHKRGMKSIAYFNIGMDGEAARRHPEYRKYSAPGKTLLTEDHYAEICVFGPCYREYLLPLIKEVFSANGVDGMFFDPTGCFNYCCCDACREQFRQATGEALRAPEETPEDVGYWTRYGHFLSDRIRGLITDIRREIHALRPDAKVVFNHIGGPFGQNVDWPGVNDEGGISCDPLAAYPLTTLFANYTGALPQKGDVFIERFARGWGDRSGLDDLTLQYKCASILMYGARVCLGDRMHPDCSLAPGSARAIKTAGGIWREMNALIPDSAERDSDIVCLISQTYLDGRFGEGIGWRHGDDALMERDVIGYLGLYRMMVDCGANFTIAPELLLEKHLRPGRLLIVPTLKWMKDNVEKSIREFVEAGGKVLFTEHLPVLADGGIPDFMGISAVEGTPCQPCVYLPDWGNERPADTERPLVEGDVFRISLSTAKAELFGHPQYDLSRMGAGYNSSAVEQWNVPLLTHNRHGRGDVYFLNAPLFTDYLAGHPDQLRWTRLLLRRIFPESRAWLESEGGNVEMASYRCPGGGRLHVLLNHGGRQTHLARTVYSEKIVAPQPVYPLRLKCRVRSKNVLVRINGRETEKAAVENGAVEIPMRMDSLWKIIEIVEG